MGLVMPKSASLTVRDELTRQFLGWAQNIRICRQKTYSGRGIVPAGDVPVDVLELGEVAESPGHVERHRGEAAVRYLVQVLSVALVHQVASAGEGGANTNTFNSSSLISNWKRIQSK